MKRFKFLTLFSTFVFAFLYEDIDSRYSPTDTVGSTESPAFSSQPYLMYDQHSSEEELEVINGQSIETEIYELPQRPSSTMTENRKRSLAQSSDEEVKEKKSILHIKNVSIFFFKGTKLNRIWSHAS